MQARGRRSASVAERESLQANARAAVRRLAVLGLGDARVSFDLGWLSRSLGDEAEAERLYKEAQSLNRGWAFPEFALGLMEMSAAEKEAAKRPKALLYERAIERFGNAIKLMPDFSQAFQMRSIAYAVLNRHAEAVESAQTAVRLRPRSAYAHYALGFAYFQKGFPRNAVDFGNAKEAFNLALTLPEDALDDATKQGVSERLEVIGRVVRTKR